MDMGEEEDAFIAALRAGDIVQHPETLEWLRIVEIEEGVVTTEKYEQGKERQTIREPYRLMKLDRLDRLAIETWFPIELYYRDIERTITRKKRRTE